MKFSDTQIDFLVESQHDINLCTGSIRSGKTFVQIIRVIDFIAGKESEPNIDILGIGKTGESFERNFVKEFLKLANENGYDGQFEYTRIPRQIRYLPKNIVIHCIGANDESAESKVRGCTAQALIGDEVTLFPKSIFFQAIGRVSAGKRYKWFTCNPDAPSHYINTDIIMNKKIDCRTWHFNLDKDNPSLKEEYKEQMKALYTGIFAERFLHGKWVLAEGVVYDKFSRKEHVKPDYPKEQIKEYVLGIDWGYEHPLAIGLFAIDYDGSYWMIDELYLRHQLIDKTLVDIMKARGWFNLEKGMNTLKPAYAYADSARPDYIAQFYNLTNITTFPAQKEVVEGIQHVHKKFVKNKAGRYGLYILESCVNMIRELESYEWLGKKGGETKDEPKKENDHLLDGTRYCIFTRERNMVKVLAKNPFKVV